MNTYPILEHRNLDKAEKRHWFSRKTRSADAVPRPGAHESLVYRVGSEFIVDDDRLAPADERILNATNVSVVDMRRDTLLVVALPIPSADASYFELLVSFTCTVTDAMTVVKGGIDAREALAAHLKAHNRIFELGLDYKLTDVNDVRRVVSAQVRAYLTHVPARVSGMQVRFASVEVSSPRPVMEFEDKYRASDFAHRLDLYEQEHLQRKEYGAARHEGSLTRGRHALDLELDGESHAHGQRKARLDLELDGESHDHMQRKARSDAQQELWLLQRRNLVARAEFEANADMINGDARRALLAAYAGGQLDAQGLSAGLKALDDSDREAMMQEALARREEQLSLRAADMEERRTEMEWQRAEQERRTAEERRIRDQAREERLEDKRAAREDLRRRETIQFEMAKQMAAQGHFNTADVGAERLFAKVVDIPADELSSRSARIVESGDRAELAGDTSGGVDEDDV